MRYRFHVNLLAEPAPTPFAVTWELAAANLAAVPRMIFEPDGSFVVSGDDEQGRWQVDGHLFDLDGRLQRVELHGECPADYFERLLRSVGWPAQPLLFELVRAGETLDEHGFRLRAANGA